MSYISMLEAELPPGFRFHPKDEELVCDYLMKKVTNSNSTLMIEVDLNKCEPWDIPETASVGSKEWYFYSQRDRKYATGLRTNRATVSGYWKATGKDRPVLVKGTLVGMRKTLVFYHGRAPKGTKTEWVMHEFRLQGPLAPPFISPLKEDWVLCRVFYKNKEVPLKPSMGSCYMNTGHSSLPALTDSYITFEHNQANNIDDEYEQVPCFSIFSQNQPNQTLSNIASSFDSSLPEIGAYLSQLSGEKKAIKAIMNQLNKMENNMNVTGSPSLGEGSSESYLSEVGMPNIWKH